MELNDNKVDQMTDNGYISIYLNRSENPFPNHYE